MDEERGVAGSVVGAGVDRGERRSRETHESRTEPEAMLFRKGQGKEAKLGHRRANDEARRVSRQPPRPIEHRARWRIEEVFGWMKTAAGFRRSEDAGGRPDPDPAAALLVASAYNLPRITKLAAA